MEKARGIDEGIWVIDTCMADMRGFTAVYALHGDCGMFMFGGMSLLNVHGIMRYLKRER